MIVSNMMDFQRANDIVDRLSQVLTANRYIGGSYLAMEWIGAESREEVMRGLYLVLAEQYLAGFPLSRIEGGSHEFDAFTGVVDGSMAHVSCHIFPMSELAAIARTTKDEPAYWNALEPLNEKAMVEMQRWESAETFAAWLKKVDPTYDDYLPMVNDHINRHAARG